MERWKHYGGAKSLFLCDLLKGNHYRNRRTTWLGVCPKKGEQVVIPSLVYPFQVWKHHSKFLMLQALDSRTNQLKQGKYNVYVV